MPSLLEVKNVSKVFRGGVLKRRDVTVAVDDVSFSISDEQAGITAIAGESGSGKTTLALLMIGQLLPDNGEVTYRGCGLGKMTHDQKTELRREVQPIFQDPFAAFNPFYRVDHVLTTPIHNFKLAKSKDDVKKMVGDALEMVGLSTAETLGRFPHQLSGGQCQRIMVARALLCHPRLIMADEPVSMVDASLRASILAGLQALNKKFGISVLYITHDLTTAYQLCENILIMYAGAMVEAGSVEKVIRFPKHPYTQLLISSIPLPDKRKHWGVAEADESKLQAGRNTTGCRFAPRCPVAMEMCWNTRPPLYGYEDQRAVACFLFRDSPTLPSPDVAQVFSKKGQK